MQKLDSQVVLWYILNNTRRFHVLVSNRVQQIRDLTSVDQCRYIPTKFNPADFASGRLDVQEHLDKKEWLFGPEFLWSNLDPKYGKPHEKNNIGVVYLVMLKKDPRSWCRKLKNRRILKTA